MPSVPVDCRTNSILGTGGIFLRGEVKLLRRREDEHDVMETGSDDDSSGRLERRCR